MIISDFKFGIRIFLDSSLVLAGFGSKDLNLRNSDLQTLRICCD